MVLSGELVSAYVRWLPLTNPLLQGALRLLIVSLVVTVTVWQLAQRMGHPIEQAEAERVRAEAALRGERDELETRVKQRTHELDGANGELRREIQERQRAEEALQQAREREAQFRTLFESTPIGIALQGPDGHYLQTNRAYQGMFGYTDDELRFPTVQRPSHWEGGALFSELVEGKLDDCRKVRCSQGKDGRLAWVESTASAVRDSNGALRYIISMVEDVTERKEAEEALRESERKKRALLEAIPDLIFRIRKDGTVVDLKAPSDTAFAFAANGLIQRILSEASLIQCGPQTIHSGEQAGQTGQPQIFEFRHAIEAEVRDFEARIVPGDEGDVLAIVRDTTELKQLERGIIEISEREQRRIGLDLHDGLGSQLTGVAFLCKALETKLAGQQLPESTDAARISALLVQALEHTRNLARGLLPAELASNDLVSGLEELCANLREVFGVECFFQCEAAFPLLEAATALQLYRITQEAANNSIKHGRTTRLMIHLATAQDRGWLRVSDNG
ncbi:MAG: PAS domain S-box protein, partial [Verrucomicrobiota bacterium]